MSFEISERKPTVVDEGWRAKMDEAKAETNNNAEATANGSKPTVVDEGWRAKMDEAKAETNSTAGAAANGKKPTVVDEGWRRGAADVLDPANVMNAATANHFRTLDEFKNAVGNLKELTSVDGKVYRVKDVISKSGGESIVLLCVDSEGNDVAAKVYYEPVNSEGSSIAARTRVPLRYNYDKPEKPRISRAFGYLARFFILFQTEKSSREVMIF